MRHRITSFRCVDGKHSMLWFEAINKTCNCGQFRQSSTALAPSGQLGTASTGAAPPATRNLPRLNAMASSSGSKADSRPLGGNVRDVVSVTIVKAAAGKAGRMTVTVLVARSHRSVSCVPKRASDPAAVATWLHCPLAKASDLPASKDNGGSWAAAGAAAANRTADARIICPAYQPWPGALLTRLSAWRFHRSIRRRRGQACPSCRSLPMRLPRT